MPGDLVTSPAFLQANTDPAAQDVSTSAYLIGFFERCSLLVLLFSNHETLGIYGTPSTREQCGNRVIRAV